MIHDSHILKHKETDQQTGATRIPTIKVIKPVAGPTDPPALLAVNPISYISSTALGHTTALATSTVSTDSTLLSTLSIHSPGTSSATTATRLTTETSPSLTSDLSSTTQATLTAVQSASLISHTSTGSAPTSSNALTSTSSTAPPPTTDPDSTRIWNSSSTSDVSSTTNSNDASSHSSEYLNTLHHIDSSGGFSSPGAAGGPEVVGGPGGSGTTATGSSTGPTVTDSQPPQNSGPTPRTNKIVGGVVGSVAGITVLFLLVLLYFRRRHASLRAARRGLPPSDVAGGAAGEGSQQSAEMTSRGSSHDAIFSAWYLAPPFMKHWRRSNQTTKTDSTLASNSSEKGFQKVSGRKIPSVLQSGGDGYGGGIGDDSSPGTEMSITFQPVPAAHPGAPTSPPTANPGGMPLDVNYTQEGPESDPKAVVRPSPARTPPASSTNLTSARTPTSPRATPEPRNLSSPTPRVPDALGRSHPSFDGSRGSRFTEGL